MPAQIRLPPVERAEDGLWSTHLDPRFHSSTPKPLKKIPLVLVGAAAIIAVLYFVVLSPRSIQAQRVSKGLVVEEALGSGSVESRRMVGVGFEVSARVAQILVDQGDPVRAGQELARLDDETFQAEVASAAREVALAQSTLKRLEADIARAQAVLEGARDSMRRTTPLVEAGTASQEKLDIAVEREKVAVAELARAEAALAEGVAATAVAEGKLHRAEVELARSVLHSPFDGVVILREREVGDVAVPGSPVLRLAASDTIWSSVWVDETHIDDLRVDLPARIVLRSDPERALPGRVARIGREVDRETRELLVDVAFEELPAQVVFGQRVDVWIELSRAVDCLRIPAGLIVRAQGASGVYVIDDGRARFREITPGIFGRGFLEVRGGLVADELVLEPRPAGRSLKGGERVEVVLDPEADGGGER